MSYCNEDVAVKKIPWSKVFTVESDESCLRKQCEPRRKKRIQRQPQVFPTVGGVVRGSGGSGGGGAGGGGGGKLWCIA